MRNDCSGTKYASDILLVKEVKNGYGRLFLWLVVTWQPAKIAKIVDPSPILHSTPGRKFLMWNFFICGRKHWVEMKEIDCQNDPCRGSITLSLWKWRDFILKHNKVISFFPNLLWHLTFSKVVIRKNEKIFINVESRNLLRSLLFLQIIGLPWPCNLWHRKQEINIGAHHSVCPGNKPSQHWSKY